MKALLSLLITLMPLYLWSQNAPEEIKAIQNQKKLQTYLLAASRWEETINAFESGAATVREIEKSAASTFDAMGNLPREYITAKYNRINKLWLSAAKACAAKKEYKQALIFLNNEMEYQFNRVPYQGQAAENVFLTNQNRYIFREVIELESEILGSLGRSSYPQFIDHYLMPVDLDRDGRDEFIAIERTTDDSERGISVPNIPENLERAIVYLLLMNETGGYDIRFTKEFLIPKGKKLEVKLDEKVQPPTIELTGVTHQAIMRAATNDLPSLPSSYSKMAKSSIKLRITLAGFTSEKGTK